MIASLVIGNGKNTHVVWKKNNQNEVGGSDYLKERRDPAIVNAVQFMVQIVLSSTIWEKYRATPASSP